MTTELDLILGARPNFMKVAPVYRELSAASWCRVRLIDTGQHYDYNMSGAFLKTLGLPRPDVSLNVGSGSHVTMIATVMRRYEEACRAHPPDWTVVVGDVNSTVACALAAVKMEIKVAHVEAGLRSFDRSMPEEVNRKVTDLVSDLLLTPSPDADANLAAEGVPVDRVVRVGNVMIDSFEMLRPTIERLDAPAVIGVDGPFIVITMHRPSNVDDNGRLEILVAALRKIASNVQIVFPVHPRTRARLSALGLLASLSSVEGLYLTEPLDYLTFMALVSRSVGVVTDSGGIQEETTYLGIPCFTVRPNTERPITLTEGTNKLVEPRDLAETVCSNVRAGRRLIRVPDLWDGKAARRVAESLHLAS